MIVYIDKELYIVLTAYIGRRYAYLLLSSYYENHNKLPIGYGISKAINDVLANIDQIDFIEVCDVMTMIVEDSQWDVNRLDDTFKIIIDGDELPHHTCPASSCELLRGIIIDIRFLTINPYVSIKDSDLEFVNIVIKSINYGVDDVSLCMEAAELHMHGNHDFDYDLDVIEQVIKRVINGLKEWIGSINPRAELGRIMWLQNDLDALIEVYY